MYRPTPAKGNPMNVMSPLKYLSSVALGALALVTTPLQAQSSAAPVVGKTEPQWMGQAAFRIKSPGSKIIVIDPWITGGPKAPPAYKAVLAAMGKVDLLLVTHAHVDHIGDAPALAKLHNTVLYGPADMITPLTTLGLLPANLGHRFNKTGHVKPLPGIKVTAVAAEYYKPDLVLMPIGGNFTMDPDDAAFAAKTWINPKAVLPMHYNSNPLAKGTLAEFTAAMKGSPVRVVPMSEGQTVEF